MHRTDAHVLNGNLTCTVEVATWGCLVVKTHFGGEGDFDVLARSDTGVVGRDLDTCSKAFLMLPKFSLRWPASNSKGAGGTDTGPSPLITLQSVNRGEGGRGRVSEGDKEASYDTEVG